MFWAAFQSLPTGLVPTQSVPDSLIHLPLYVKIHGALDNFGCFKYENYLQEIKYSIKGGRYPLQELCNRILEKQKVFLSTPILPFQHLTVKEIENTTSSLYYKLNDTHFENIILHDLNICINILKKKDKYIILQNDMLIVVNHIVKPYNKNEINLVVQQFVKSTSFFMRPIDSKIIDSQIVDTTLLSNNFSVNLNEIKYKCLYVQITDNKAIVTSLRHSLYNK